MVYKKKFFLSLISAVMFLYAGDGWTLPFNDDMVDSQVKTGAVMRPRVEGTVPAGSLKYRVEDKADAAARKNPVKSTFSSVQKGARLFAVNCYPCHGKISKTGYRPGPVGKFLPGPNLADPFYHGRTDGEIFATIRYGNVLMQGLGWKLSLSETWDLVNYVREVQKGK